MKTSKEFFEKLQTDEEFRKEISLSFKEKYQSGDDYNAIIAIANEKGYELSQEEVDALYDQTAELSDEELEKVSGGTTAGCIMASLFITEIIFTIGATIYESVNQ